MEPRELLMAGTAAAGVSVDPARMTLAAGRLLPGASCDRGEQVTVSQPWIWNGFLPRHDARKLVIMGVSRLGRVTILMWPPW